MSRQMASVRDSVLKLRIPIQWDNQVAECIAERTQTRIRQN